MTNKINVRKLSIVVPLLGVTRGGGIRVIAEIANGITELGHNVALVTGPLECFPFPLNDNVKLFSRMGKKNESNISRQWKDFFFIYRTCLGLEGIIISNYYTSFFIAWLLQILQLRKHVYFIQGYEAEFFDNSQSLINKVKTVLAKITYLLKPSLRITISEFIKNKIGKQDIVIINDGIDPTIFKPNAKLKANNKKLIISAIAINGIRKGFSDFVKAIGILEKLRNDFEVLLFTNQTTVDLEIPIKFTIRFPENDKELVECMQMSNIFVSPSHLEGFGLPGLEAMACGVTLVTTNSGGINQYAINEVNALIVDVGDSNAMVESLQKLLDDHMLLNRLSREGLETAKKFTWAIMCENFEKELLKLTNN